MKKLYALLIILIVIYVGINIGSMDFSFNDSLNDADEGNVTEDNVTEAVDNGMVAFGASSFSKIDNFTDTAINDTAVSLFDKSKNMTINVSEIDNSQTIDDIANSFYANNVYTSSQLIDQNGVSTYFLYNEVTGHYSSDIFFNKNGQNYRISGENIPYEDSDYFINHCKGIIDDINVN